MKRVKLLALTMVVTILTFALCACGGGIEFSMHSYDVVGSTYHTVVGGDIEPSGQYTIVCKSGHGLLNINDEELYVFAADEFIGEEYFEIPYVETATLELHGNDELMASAFNGTDFKLVFTYVE